mmetsp:Transcript_41619/g.119397  ORF Transcript_41619/g.119397 Transcript_41619/m.119397 type:complete len:309 (+) Transcript_41619:202-1128(+)
MERSRLFMSSRRFHSCLREAGSMPLVGSSRKTTGAAPRSEVATHRRRFWPPLSFLHCSWSFSCRPSSASICEASLSGSLEPRSAAKNRKCCATVYSSYMGLSCGQMARFQRQRSMSVMLEWPITMASPEVMGVIPVMQLMTVVFPAPLCPSSANNSAERTSNDMSSTAVWVVFPLVKVLVMFLISRGHVELTPRPPSPQTSGARRGQRYRGWKQKVSGFALPYSPCHTWSNQYAKASQSPTCRNERTHRCPAGGTAKLSKDTAPSCECVSSSAKFSPQFHSLPGATIPCVVTDCIHQISAKPGTNPVK